MKPLFYCLVIGLTAVSLSAIANLDRKTSKRVAKVERIIVFDDADVPQLIAIKSNGALKVEIARSTPAPQVVSGKPPQATSKESHDTHAGIQ